MLPLPSHPVPRVKEGTICEVCDFYSLKAHVFFFYKKFFIIDLFFFLVFIQFNTNLNEKVFRLTFETDIWEYA